MKRHRFHLIENPPVFLQLGGDGVVGVAEGGGAFSRSLDHTALAEVKTFCNGKREGEGERE